MNSRLFPAKIGFPPAVEDIGDLSGDEPLVRLQRDAVGIEHLANHRALRTLWCSGIDAERLEALARCEQLEELYLEDVRGHDLEPLTALTRLEVLGIDGATKVESLDWLDGVRPLLELRLQHFPRVRSLEPLASQPELRALDVSGSTWGRMRVAWFSPLSALRGLRLLYLTNIQCRDGSLRVIAGLDQLTELHIAGFHDWQEFATLSGLSPDIRCDWFEPFVELGHEACAVCGTPLVMLTGKRQPTLCPRCNANRVERHVNRFLRARKKAARQNDGPDGIFRRR